MDNQLTKSYKAVFIDWDDTIGDFVGAAKRALRDMYEKYNLSDYFDSHEEFVSLYKPHNIELWDKYGKDLVTKDYLSLDRFLFPLMHGSKTIKNFELEIKNHSVLFELAQKMSEEFLRLTTNYFSLLDGAEELVRYLSKKYPLTVVTNGFVEVQYEKFEKSGLQDCFAHIVLSEEVGCQKPNAQIFEEALRRNGVSADEVIMIGDSWNSDIQGAINAGIDQIWVRWNKVQDEPDKKATYMVGDLHEIMEIL